MEAEMNGTVLVLGATGMVGGMVAELLAQRGERVRAASRKLGERLAGQGLDAEWIEFDFERPETFAPALAGVARVFMLARPGDDEPQRVAAPLIAEMRTQGVRRVVNLTAMGTELRPDFGLRQVEVLLECSGIGYTHLRPNFFMQIFSGGMLADGIQRHSVISVPAADARLSFIDAADIAAVAAVALVSDGHEGQAYTLTGGEALTHGDVAQEIGRAMNRDVRYVAASEEVARQAMVAAGLSPERAERLINFYRLVRSGWCSPVTSAVSDLLGRPPMSFGQFARRQAAAGCW